MSEPGYSFDAFFNMSLDLLCIANTDGYFLELNPAFSDMLGWSDEELKSRPFLDFVHPDDIEATLAEVEKLAAGQTTIRFENRYATKDGEWRWLSWTSRPDPNGLLYSAARDITEQKRLQEALLAANGRVLEASRAKSRFLANMSHELRTPLNAIIGYSEMLMEEAVDEGRGTEARDLKRIQDSGHHLLGLINEVLDLSKIESGRMQVHSEPTNVDELLDRVIDSVAPLVTRNNNRLEIRRPDRLGSINTDMTKVRQILLNLLSNAAKFTHDGEITLAAARRDDGNRMLLELHVRDSGIGMSPDELERVFEPFVQADTDTARKYGGTGLGMTISRHFAEMLGGALTIKSSKGEGTEVTLTLPDSPVQDLDEYDGPRRTPDKSPRVAGGSYRVTARDPDSPSIVVIDDDPAAGELLARSLSRAGYDVTVAHSGNEGLRMIRELKPAAVTLDIMMPEMDGWSVLSQLKRDEDLQDIPVIMISMMGDRELGYVMGVEEFMTKPVSRERLLELVRRFAKPADRGEVLVVDDEPTARELAARLLRRDGWTVREAENGLAALDAVRDAPPDLILLDLMMPEMDGFEFVEAMKREPIENRIPIVVLTAKDVTEVDIERLNGGIDRLLQKGAQTGTELLNEVEGLLTSRLGRNRTGDH